MSDGTNGPVPPVRVIDWPAVWARDEKFWREVATRTIAGALALVLLGGPSVVYLMIAGQLSASVVIPILIGMAFVALAIIVWWIVRRASRAIERRSLSRAVERDAENRRPAGIPSPAALQQFVREFQAAREARGDPFGEALEESMRPKSGRISVSPDGRREMREIERRINLWALVAMVVGTSLIGVLLSLFVR